jgi:hypothetical protein
VKGRDSEGPAGDEAGMARQSWRGNRPRNGGTHLRVWSEWGEWGMGRMGLILMIVLYSVGTVEVELDVRPSIFSTPYLPNSALGPFLTTSLQSHHAGREC